MIRITLAFNAIHLEAARRLQRQERAVRRAPAPPDGDGSLGRARKSCRWLSGRVHLRGRLDAGLSLPKSPLLDLLVYEPQRMGLTAEDRRLWSLQAPVQPLLMGALSLLALFGLVQELRLSHLTRVGRSLLLLARWSQRLCLLDDGLDQYRSQPRAMRPEAFPAGTPCWLFSDAPAFRAAWCKRFTCGDLGPLYDHATPTNKPRQPPPPPEPLPDAASLVIDAPGLERLLERPDLVPSPRRLVAHPVKAKRSWPLPAGPGDHSCSGPPEPLIAAFRGLVVVGESMTLLSAVRLRPRGSRLLVALPLGVDPNLERLVRSLAAADPAITVL